MSKRISQEDKKVAGYDGRSPDREEVIFPERRAAFHDEMESLREEKAKLKTTLSLDPEEMISQLQEIDRKIRQTKNYINQRGATATVQDNNARTNIQRNIRTAVDAILLESPGLKPYLNMELPGRTVNTVIRCSYLPGPYERARWNLDPPRVGGTLPKVQAVDP